MVKSFARWFIAWHCVFYLFFLRILKWKHPTLHIFLCWMKRNIFQIIPWLSMLDERRSEALRTDVCSCLAPSIGEPRASLPFSLSLFPSPSRTPWLPVGPRAARVSLEGTTVFSTSSNLRSPNPCWIFSPFFLFPLVGWSMLPTILKRPGRQER